MFSANCYLLIGQLHVIANVMDMHTLLVGAEEENQNRSELLYLALGIRHVLTTQITKKNFEADSIVKD